MSQTPSAAEATPTDAYLVGWRALNKLMRRGHSWSGNERNSAFLNLGGGLFADASHASGFGVVRDGRSVATLDYDFDGDLDLVATNRDAPRAMLYEGRADTAAAGVVALRLIGTRSNRAAIGARVELAPRNVDAAESTRKLVRAVRAGEGYLAQSTTWLHFPTRGLEIESARVVWPGGEVEEITGLRPGFQTLTQGEGAARPFDPSGETRAPRRVPELAHLDLQASPSPRTRVVLAAPIPLPRLTLGTDSGGEIALFGIQPGGRGTGTGRPILLNLWSSTCAPCLAELGEYAERASELEEAGVSFLAVSVDEDPAAARAALERVQWPFAWALASEETALVLDALHAAVLDTGLPLPLPTSFLVDPDGGVRALYAGRVAPERLFQDLRLVDLDEDGLLAAATPWQGTWHTRPALDVSRFEAVSRERGLTDVLQELARGRIHVSERSRAEILVEFGRDQVRAGKLEAAIETMRSAIEADPELFQARFDLGLLQQRTGKPFDAIGAYLAALELDPDHEDAHYNLALAYLETGQKRSAEGELEALRERGSPLADELVAVMRAFEER